MVGKIYNITSFGICLVLFSDNDILREFNTRKMEYHQVLNCNCRQYQIIKDFIQNYIMLINSLRQIKYFRMYNTNAILINRNGKLHLQQ